MERATTLATGCFYLTLDPTTLAPFPTRTLAAKFFEGAPPLSPLESFILRTAVNSTYVLQIEVIGKYDATACNRLKNFLSSRLDLGSSHRR